MWGGHEDQYDASVRRGYWHLGWSNTEQPELAGTRDRMQPGDRLAIKRMLGLGSPEIKIRALGVLKELAPLDKRVYIHWAATGLTRRVAAKGCFASIHDPFVADEEWARRVFQL